MAQNYNPLVRQRAAYALGGSQLAYWASTERAGIYGGPSNINYGTFLVYTVASLPPYTPPASQQWPCVTRVTWAYGVPYYRSLTAFGTLATTLTGPAGRIYLSYAFHVGSYDADLGVLDALAPYPLLQSTYFPVRRDNEGTENIFVAASFYAQDRGSIFDPEEAAKVVIGNWAGFEDPDGVLEFNNFTLPTIYDAIEGTSFGGTVSSQSFAGTSATIVFRARTKRSFYVSGFSVRWKDYGNNARGTLFNITQDSDPLWFISGEQMGNWGYNGIIGSGHQFIATFIVHFAEGSHNINGYNPDLDSYSPNNSGNSSSEIDGGTFNISREIICGVHATVNVGVLRTEASPVTLSDAETEIVIIRLEDSVGVEELLPAYITDTDSIIIEDYCDAWVRGGKRTIFITDERYRGRHSYMRKL